MLIKQFQILVVIVSFGFAFPSLADENLGMSYWIPSDSAFDSGGLTLYWSHTAQSESNWTWRTDLDWRYALDPESVSVEYTAWGGRLSLVRKFDNWYFGAGPTANAWKIVTEEPGCCLDPGIRYFGVDPTSSLVAKIWNNRFQNTEYTPGAKATEKGTDYGGHIFGGYHGNMWHAELLFDYVSSSDLVDLGGLQFRFGFSF